MVVLGLTRVPDDEVAAERGARLAAADVGDAAREPVAIAPTTHPPQQGLADVLQRQIEVRHARVADGIDQLVGQVARVEVEQARPVDARRHCPDQCNDRTCAELVGPVLAVARQVLGDEHDLAGFELVDLAQDRIDVAAALRPAERRDRAEPARSIAPLGDLHVCPRAGALRPGQVEQVEGRDLRRAHRDRSRRATAGEAERDRHAESGDLIHLGQRVGQLLAVALGHATGDNQAGTALALIFEGQDGVDRLLAGLVDERAGVDDHQVGLRRVVGGLHAIGQQRADQLVAVDLVLRAPQGLDVEALPHRCVRLPARHRETPNCVGLSRLSRSRPTKLRVSRPRRRGGARTPRRSSAQHAPLTPHWGRRCLVARAGP